MTHNFDSVTLDRLNRIYSSRKNRSAKYILESGDEEFIDSCIPKSAIGTITKQSYQKKIHWIQTKLPDFLAEQQKLKDSGGVECLLCGFISHALYSHIQYSHELKVSDYREQFGDDVVIASEDYTSSISNRVKGSNNPAYQHGGRLSPYSKKFVKYQDLNEEETNQKLLDMKDKIAESFTPDKRPVKIEYYLAKGMNLKEATKALSERQSTFSLDKCVEKYGILEGTFVWQDRQDKWQATLNSKSEEEMRIINSKKITFFGASKPEKELLELIKTKHPETEDQFQIYYDVNAQKKRWFMYDIKVGNAIIEFQGDFWHRNPKMYDKDFSILIYDKRYTTSEIWEKDARKQKLAEDSGFKFYAVWEHDYMNDYDNTIKNIFDFIDLNK